MSTFNCFLRVPATLYRCGFCEWASIYRVSLIFWERQLWSPNNRKKPFKEVPFVPCNLRIWISFTIGVSTNSRTGWSPACMILQSEGSRIPITSKQDGLTSVSNDGQSQWGWELGWSYTKIQQSPSLLPFAKFFDFCDLLSVYLVARDMCLVIKSLLASPSATN